MKLSDQERRVLGVLAAIGDASVPRLAKEARLREHVARFALHALISRGVIRYFPCINSGALGYSSFSVYFSLAPSKNDARERFLQKLISHPNVSWVAHIGGDFDYAVTFQTFSSVELVEFVDSISSSSGIEITSREVRVDAALRYYPLKAFRHGIKQYGVDVWRGGVTPISTDDLDRKILYEMSNSGITKKMELARKLTIPTTTLQSRIERLEKAQAITGYVYFLVPQAAGLRTFKLRVLAKKLNAEFAVALEKLCHRLDHVSLFVRCLGAWDFEINVDVKHAEEVDGVIAALHDQFASHIRDIRKGEIFSHRKASDFPFRY